MELPGAVAIEQVPDGGGDDDVQHLETPGDAPQYEHAHRSVTLTPIPSPRRSKVAMMSHTQSQSNLVTYIPGIAFISIALLTLYYIDVVAEVMMMVFVITSRGHVDNIQHWDSALVAGLKNTYNCSGTFHRDLDDHLIVDLDCQHSLAAMELLIEGASFASLLPPPPPRYIVRDPGHHVGCTSGIVDDRGQYMCHWMSTGASCVITMVDIFSDITFVSKQIDWCPGTVTQLHLRVMEAPYYEDMSYAHHQRLFVSAFVLLLIKEVLKLSIFLMMVVSKRMRRFSIISLFIHNMMTGVAFACSQTFGTLVCIIYCHF